MKPFIKKVEIRNYKTHKNTRIIFGEGVNSIVGPNGVGKSNILEAIIFGLGERSPKALRVSSFSEIVHNNRKDIDVSVSLTLIDKYGNEHLFKRIYSPKRGEHKYRYNGRRTARSSYLLNLMKLGGKGFKYVYIQQGDILNRANATPKDIKEIVDEALGIKQYEEKKADALKKLEEAEKKLETLEGKYSEIQKFIREYMKDMINYHTLENVVTMKKIITASKATLQKREIEKELDKIKRKKEKLAKYIEKLDFKIDEIERRLKKISDTASTIDKKIEDIERNIIRKLNLEKESKNKEKFNILNKLAQLNSELKRVIDTINDKKDEIERIRKIVVSEGKELRRLNRSKAEIKKNLQKVEKDRDEKKERLKDIEREIEELNEYWRKKLNEFENKIESRAKKLAEKIYIEYAYDEIKNEIKRLERREKNFSILIDSLTARRKKLLTTYKKLRKEAGEIKNRIKKKKEKLKIMEKEISDAKKLLKKLEKVMSRMTRERKAEQEYYVHAKSVYDAAKTLGISNIIGIFGEMIKGPKEIIPLIREVNPRTWYSIVVKDNDTAEKILNIARELNKNIAVIVLSDYTDINLKIKIHKKSIINILKYPKKIEKIVLNYLGNIIIVSDEDKIIDEIKKGYSIIDITGDFIIGGGIWLRAEKTAIRIPRNISKMNEIYIKFSKMIKNRENKYKEEKKDLDKLINSYKTIVSRLSFLKQSEKFLITQLDYFRKWIKELNEKKLKLEKRIKEKPIVEEKEERELDKIKLRIENLKNIKEEFEKDIEDLDKKIEEISKKLYEIDYLTKLYKNSNLDRKNRIEKLKEDIRKLKIEMNKIKEELNTKEKERDNIEKEIADITNKIEKMKSKIDKLKERRRKILDSYKRGEEIKNKYIRRREELSRKQLDTIWKIKESKKEISSLERIIDDTGVGEKILKKTEYLDEISSTLIEELGELEGSSKYSEHRYYAHINDYKMYSLRRKELLVEREKILDFIRDIDAEKERVFREGFTSIKERFYKMFDEVFPYSNVYLELEDPDNIDSNIYIYVEFKDKPRLPLSALSGGEKTAIILLFLLSVYSIKEDTVFLLDEIDAHLDIRNLGSIAKVIDAQKKYGQIILITLPGHDSIINISDYIIPVVFRNGVSRVFQLSKEYLERLEKE